MTKNKINIGFSHLNGPRMQATTRDIIAAMTGNDLLPDPEPSIATVAAQLETYTQDSIEAAAGSRAAVVNKALSRKQLELTLGLLGLWIMSVAKNDLSILATCGYTISKQPEPRYITAPGVVTLVNGLSSGQLVAATPVVKGANGYQFEISEVAPGEGITWVSTITTTSKYTYKNLVPGKQYWVRVAAAGSRQQLEYSEVVSKFVQ
jgi:hypothetical protein